MTSFKAYFKKVFSRFGQMLYLTISNFTKNALWESASACAFGFIFSFIPVTMIIFTVLVGILRIYPNIYNFIISFTEQFDSVVKITPVLDKMLEIDKKGEENNRRIKALREQNSASDKTGASER